MEINDRVYKKVSIDDPLIIELIKSKPVQRLMGINQAGASAYVLQGKDVTRFEHSLGVMILLLKLGASREEQVAGLLHDIGHTAFSHVIDFVFTNTEHDYHESFYDKMVLDSDIPTILKKHGLSFDDIKDLEQFSLLEKPLPDLCADRIDYFFRDTIATFGSVPWLPSMIDKLIVVDNEIILKDTKSAELFARKYLQMDIEYWSAPLEVALFQVLADALKIALSKNIITEPNLFLTDDEVMIKLKESKNEKILAKISQLKPGFKIALDKNHYDFFSRTKLRYVDPKSADGTRVSQLSPQFKQELEKHKKRNKDGNYIKIM